MATTPNVNVQMTADEFAKYQQRPKYITQGQKTAAGLSLGGEVLLGGLQAMATQRQINQYKKQLRRRKRQLEREVVTDKMLADANMQAEAVERELDALEGVRGTVGGSGAREDIKRRATKKAQQRYATTLSGLAQAELGKRQQIADLATAEQQQMSALQYQLPKDIIERADAVKKDEALAGLFGEAGKQRRDTMGQDVEKSKQEADERRKKVWGK